MRMRKDIVATMQLTDPDEPPVCPCCGRTDRLRWIGEINPRPGPQLVEELFACDRCETGYHVITFDCYLIVRVRLGAYSRGEQP